MPELDLPQRQATRYAHAHRLLVSRVAADRVHRNQLHKATLLEIPLVIGRDRAQTPLRLARRLPSPRHAAALRTIRWREVECSYHGWQFDAHNGQCAADPVADGRSEHESRSHLCGQLSMRRAGRISSGFTFRIRAAGRGISKRDEAPDAAPQIEKFSEKYKLAYLTADMPVSIDHGIIGLMDPAHGPFVHQAWWWRSRHSIHEKKKNFEPIPNGFRMSAHTPSSNSAPYKLLRLYADADSITTTIDFVLPNLRSEMIRAGKYWFSSSDHGDANHAQSVPHRRRRRVEHFPLAAFRRRVAEVRFCEIRRAGPPHHGTASRRPASTIRI